VRGLTREYLIRRCLLFFLTLWIAATILFILPRLAPGDPVQAMVARMRQQGTRVQDSASIIATWRARFGLDEPVPVQYLRYLGNLVRGDMGYSLTYFPATVSELIGRALPWTIGLLTVATLIAFVMGTTIGALLGWRGTPALVRNILPLTLVFTSIPAFMLSIMLIYVFGFGLNLLPISGGYGRGIEVAFSWDFISSAIQHSILPALSIIFVSMGFVALGMRGMMITVANEDYLVLAKIKGLTSSWIFWRYAVRNSILPQITAFALSLGSVVAGATLVETIFSYPGMGHLMYQAISSQDYSLIGGIGFVLIATTATAVFILDLVYPLIDPRITYKKK
jgi:peptide/nickel transport system permease protein